jgi:hypothetical protein
MHPPPAALFLPVVGVRRPRGLDLSDRLRVELGAAIEPRSLMSNALLAGRRLVLMSLRSWVCVSCLLFAASSAWAQTSAELRVPSDFSTITDVQARSRALFSEAAKVIMNPRCMNCHPAGDRPTQGNDMHPHFPATTRGPDGGGVAGNSCGAWHLGRNVDIFVGQQTSFRSIPGHPRWGLAPIEMAWEGKNVGEICRQIKDPQRNGGRNLELLHEHLAKDDLVAWGWNPGAGRDPAPGSQQRLGELIRAWIDTGADCP